MPDDVMIGLEIHVQIDTQSKLFCSCPIIASEPNTAVCDVCVGLPGSKPVLNQKVLDSALQLCLAVDCTIAPELIFSRKIYFYPDMGKNYQVTQYELPLGKLGKLSLGKKVIDITRIHIEEDPASLIHQGSTVLVDYNRSGHPLCEIVTEPQLKSAAEAREFLRRLSVILKYLHIFDEQHCIIKADANVSIAGGQRVEIKNITGFKEIERAIEYEIERQRVLLKEGKPVTLKETRGWDADKGMTLFQRSKESEEDYGYILDPDLVPISLSAELVAKTRKALPELPLAKIDRYVKMLKLKADDADVLANDYDLAQLFENAVHEKVPALVAAEWIQREVPRVLNYAKKSLGETFVAKQVVAVLGLLHGKISRQTGQRLMELLVEQDLDVVAYVKKNGLELVADTKLLDELCAKIIINQPKAVQEVKGGSEKALSFLIGQVVKETKGKADPKIVGDLFRKKLL